MGSVSENINSRVLELELQKQESLVSRFARWLRDVVCRVREDDEARFEAMKYRQ